MEDIVYRKPVQSDVDEIHKFYLNEFLGDEPMRNMVGIPLEEMKPFVDCVMESAIDDDISYVAVAEGEIIGIRMSLKHTKDRPKEFKFADTEDNRGLIRYAKALDQLYDGVDLFEFFGSDKVVLLKGLSVRRSYRNKGVAKHLTKITLDECKRQGFVCLVVESSNNYSRAVFDGLGFKRLREIEYEKLVVDGVKMIDKVDESNKMLVSHTLKME